MAKARELLEHTVRAYHSFPLSWIRKQPSGKLLHFIPLIERIDIIRSMRIEDKTKIVIIN